MHTEGPPKSCTNGSPSANRFPEACPLLLRLFRYKGQSLPCTKRTSWATIFSTSGIRHHHPRYDAVRHPRPDGSKHGFVPLLLTGLQNVPLDVLIAYAGDGAFVPLLDSDPLKSAPQWFVHAGVRPL